MPFFRKITKTRQVHYIHNSGRDASYKASKSQKEIIEDLEESNNILIEENMELKTKLLAVEFVLTVTGLLFGWFLNKTYRWF